MDRTAIAPAAMQALVPATAVPTPKSANHMVDEQVALAMDVPIHDTLQKKAIPEPRKKEVHDRGFSISMSDTERSECFGVGISIFLRCMGLLYILWISYD